MTTVNANSFVGPNQGNASGYIPDTTIESGKVDADFMQVKNDLDYHLAVLQNIYSKLDAIETGATGDQTAAEIVSLINSSAFKIDLDNLSDLVASLSHVASTIESHRTTTVDGNMHPETSIKSTGLTYSNTPAALITSCVNLLDEIKNIRYQIHRMNGKSTWVDTPDDSLSGLKLSINTLISNLAAHSGNISNPHSVTKSQVGLGNVDNVKQATKNEFDTHAANISNPHGVTKTQVGLGSVDDVKQASKIEFDAHTSNSLNPHAVTKTQIGLGNVDNIQQATKSEFDAHAANTSNPHSVTKSQVGLGNVDDMKQATKVEFDSHVADILNPHNVTKSQVGLGNVDNVKQATKAEFDSHASSASAHHARYTDAEAIAAASSLMELVVVNNDAFLLKSDDALVNMSNTMSKIKEIVVPADIARANVKVTWEAGYNAGSSRDIRSQLYINDTPVGTLYDQNNNSTFITRTENISCVGGDRIQVWGYYYDNLNTGGQIQNFRIRGEVKYHFKDLTAGDWYSPVELV